MADDHAFNVHFAGLWVDFNVCDPGCPGGAKTRPAAMDIARVRKALTLKPTILRAPQAWLVMGFPVGALGGGLNQFACSGVLQQFEAILDGVNTGGSRQFVDETFVRERIRQGRDPT